MAAVELAVGYVTLTVETKSLARDVGRAFTGVESQAGRSGQAMGRAMAQSFEANKPDIDSLRREVWTAHQKITAAAEQSAKKQQDASRKVEIAQAKVNETIEKYGAASSQALTAADRLSTAQQRLESETMAAASAQEKLERELRDAQTAVTEAANSSETAARTYATGWRGVGQRVKEYLSAGIEDATDGVEAQAEEGGRQGGSVFATAFQAGLGVIAAKFSVDAITNGISDALNGAGDMEQSIGALESVFKDSSGQMMGWSRTAATAVGLSSNEYNELGTLLGAQLKNAGVDLDQAGEKANGLIGTGADLSSMFGGPAAEAVEALSSALKGEMDPIEKYGITLNEATLKAQAMASGLLAPVKDAAKVETSMMKMDLAQRKYNEALGKHGPESDQAMSAQIALTGAQNAFNTASEGSLPAMDSQTKAMATLAAIEKQSADAKGNFAKESDTFSHKQQVAAAQWEDLSTKMGGIFLPAATEVYGFVGDKLIPVFDEIVGGVLAFGAAFNSSEDDITSSGFAGHMERFGQIARDSVAWVKDNSETIGIMAGVITTLLLPALITAGVQATISAAKQVAGWFAAGWQSTKTAALYLINSYQIIGNWIAMGLAAIKSGAQTAYVWALYKIESAKAVGSMIAARAKIIGSWVMMGVQSMLAGAKMAAAWVLAMGPIGWIIGGIALLVGGFILAYNKIGWFKDGVNAVLKAVGGIFVWLWESAILPAFEGIKIGIAAVAAVFTWWLDTVVRPIFSSIFTIVNGFYLFFRQIFLIVVALFQQVIAPAFVNFWQGVVKPVFEAIGLMITLWWVSTKATFTAVVDFVKTVFSTVFTWLRDSVITPVFDFIKTAISLWWGAVKFIFNAVITFVKTVFSAVFTWLRDSVITPVFGFIKNTISAWWTGVKFIFDTVISFVKTTLGNAFTWLRDTIITPVWNGIRDTIKSVWENGIKPVFDFLSGAIKDDVPKAFQNGVDAVKKIWDGILEIAKAPVRFVINTVVNDGLIGGMNKLSGMLGIAPLAPVGLPAGFRDGGYTGKLGREQIAGIVHGDEHVIRSESRRSIESAAPGLLESFNQMGARALAPFGFRKGGRVNPTKNMSLTQGYSAFHDGIDIGVGIGTPVFAAGDGVVTLAGQGASAPGVSGGTEVHVRGDGIEQWYAHLSEVGVQLGQQVSAGQQIALSGNTGISSGPHLHFGTYAGGWPNAMNPLSYLAGASAPEGGSSGPGWLDPFGMLVKLADGVLQKVRDAVPGGGFMVDAAAGIGKRLITDVIGWGKGKLGMGGVTGSPTLFDGGGWLTNTGGPQLIDHQRSRPDAVLTNQQWRDVHTLAVEDGERGNDSKSSVRDELEGMRFEFQIGSEVAVAKMVRVGERKLQRT